MPIYWSMLLVTVVLGLFCYVTPQKKMTIEGCEANRVNIAFVFVIVAYIVFFLGFRDKVLDTGTYIASFNALPDNFKDFLLYLSDVDSDIGFYLLAGLFKVFISQEHYAWLFFLALVSCVCVFRTLYKYSVDFPLTAYLFIATTTFTWILNGSRQFLVVSILFGFVDWLIERKKLKYIFLILILTTIHSSAIFMVVIVLFVSSEEIFGKRMLLFMILTVIGTYYSENIFEFLRTASDSLDYSETLGMGGGSNVIRLLEASIPVLIVLLNLENVKKIAPRSIKLAINMSLIGNCFYFTSTFTNGILIGRMPIYFTIYNLFLLPWVIRNCFTRESKKIVGVSCVVCYLAYFYYQMCITWDGLMYVSDILNLRYY